MLTSESIKMINNLKNKISYIHDTNKLKELFNLLQNHKYNYEEPNSTNVNKNFLDYKVRFIKDNLYDQFKEYNMCKEVTWVVNSNYTINCKLYIFYKNKILSKIINSLVNATSFIMSLSNRNLDVTINILLLDDKKIFNGEFTSNEINSVMADYNGNIIHIWRKEEVIKVLIHECIHILGFSELRDTNKIIDHYNQRYNINCNMMNINESYTEIWAKLLNCYYISSMADLKKKEKLNLFLFFIQIEKEFSFIQSYKIKEFIKNNINININKDTNVVAYYLILSEILKNLNLFLTNFNFYLNDNNNFINFLLNLPPTQKDYNSLTKNLKNTFRMTVVELKL